MKKILILYTSVGLGHKAIAENIGYRLEKAGFTVRLEDILKVQDGKLIQTGKKVHEWLLFRLSWLWKWLYTSQGFARLTWSLRTVIAGRNYGETLKVIQEFNPDMVITTQTTASAVLDYLKMKGLYKGLFGITFSDFHFHPFWVYKNANFYLANIEEQKLAMKDWGVNPSKVFICGMTLKELAVYHAPTIKQKLGIGEQEQVVLVAGGSLGAGMKKEFIDRLLQHFSGKVIIVCGKNEEVYGNFLKAYQSNSQVLVFGYYKPMDELYSIADVLVTKPGGLSVSEALRHHLPMQISYWLPGQEELNFWYLVKKGLVMPPEKDAVKQILNELETGAFRISLKHNAFIPELVGKDDSAAKAVSSQFHK